jgi:hypothetical protein
MSYKVMKALTMNAGTGGCENANSKKICKGKVETLPVVGQER